MKRRDRTVPATLAALLAACMAVVSDARIEPGTFSILARDPCTGEIGVAVQSRAFNVGLRVPWALAGTGAIATQSWTNASFGPRGLELLDAGLDAGAVLESLLRSDEGRAQRQLAVLDARGGTASWTGESCMDWAGGIRRENLAVQGNILASEGVVAAMVEAFDTTPGTLAERLLAALEGAQRAGGDRRGQQSAALLVVRESESHPEYRQRFVQLRVDDHVSPIQELRRLYTITLATHLAGAYLDLADEAAAAGDTARAEIERSLVARSLATLVADPAVGAGELNAIAWESATRDLFLEDAHRAASRAVALEPTGEVLDTLAEVEWRMGAFDDAVTTGRRALALSPGDPYLTSQLRKFEASQQAGVRVVPEPE